MNIFDSLKQYAKIADCENIFNWYDYPICSIINKHNPLLNPPVCGDRLLCIMSLIRIKAYSLIIKEEKADLHTILRDLNIETRTKLLSLIEKVSKAQSIIDKYYTAIEEDRFDVSNIMHDIICHDLIYFGQQFEDCIIELTGSESLANIYMNDVLYDSVSAIDPRSQINDQPLFTMTDMDIKFIDSKLGGLAYIETDDTYKDYKFCFKVKSNNINNYIQKDKSIYRVFESNSTSIGVFII
ncbi:hypothetical protein [Phocaeicola coprocola]|uniref:hypothetical protein n=1 Tax=Phocaeicola coprocola TaxID=310298 RepID=UPI003AF0FEDD